MKKIIIPIIVFLILVVGGAGFILFNNRVVSTITLDINPSIEINLKKNNKIKSIKALNEDAKEVVNNNLKGKTLDEAIEDITNKIVDKGYVEDIAVILIHSEGNIDKINLEEKIRNNFREKGIATDVITVETITKEDKEIAKKYNISPAKAAYINSIAEEMENIEKDNLINKPIDELKETKEKGIYCNDGYELDGDFCLKEIRRETASNGEVCPEGYYEYNNKCYEEVRNIVLDNLICRDEFELNGNECYRTLNIDAEPVKYACEKGEEKTRRELGLTNREGNDADDIVCADLSSATHPVTPCELPADDPTERTMVGGRCYWHRAPVIQSGCPGKIQVNGFCWDDASSVYICAGYRDGRQYSSKSEYCENSIKLYDPVATEYKCPDDFELSGNKCSKKEIESAHNEVKCPQGYTKLETDRCINVNKTIDKVNGLVCSEENSKISGDTCIIYEIIEANHN